MAQMKQIDPLVKDANTTLKYGSKPKESFPFNELRSVMASNRLFAKDDIAWYDKFSRFGYIDPFNTEQVTREFLFFTKPDLNLFTGNSYKSSLNPVLTNIPFFVDANTRNGNAMRQLCSSVKDNNGHSNPFMYLLSNSVTSKLDLPGISAESRESTSNIMGTSIQYRGHSLKSDNGYDFTLSFTDTAYLEVYTLLKVYDEYMRLLKMGEISPKQDYIINRIISEQFSIYKFLIGEDGETILYYAKLTGCYFTDVPRADFSDPSPEGFKFSVSFHAQFVEDNNPMILEEFNRISPKTGNLEPSPTYNSSTKMVNNEWARFPRIVVAGSTDYKQVARRGTMKDYRMQWYIDPNI